MRRDRDIKNAARNPMHLRRGNQHGKSPVVHFDDAPCRLAIDLRKDARGIVIAHPPLHLRDHLKRRADRTMRGAFPQPAHLDLDDRAEQRARAADVI